MGLLFSLLAEKMVLLYLMVIALAVASSAEGIECSAGFVALSGRCYLFSGQLGEAARSWEQARLFCQVLGGDLATLGREGASDADPVLKYIYDNGIGTSWLGAKLSGSSYSWLDGR